MIAFIALLVALVVIVLVTSFATSRYEEDGSMSYDQPSSGMSFDSGGDIGIDLGGGMSIDTDGDIGFDIGGGMTVDSDGDIGFKF